MYESATVCAGATPWAWYATFAFSELSILANFVLKPPSRMRRQLQDANMPSQNAPDDDNVRQTHNFAPGYYGLVYVSSQELLGLSVSDVHQATAQMSQTMALVAIGRTDRQILKPAMTLKLCRVTLK